MRFLFRNTFSGEVFIGGAGSCGGLLGQFEKVITDDRYLGVDFR
jgi:hypothetical protein